MCCTQYASKFGKLSSSHRTGKDQFSFQSHRRANAKECSNYCTTVLISHASKVVLKILATRLQQHLNWELPDAQAVFKKAEEPEIKLPALNDLDSVLKTRDITLTTRVHIVRAIVFPVVTYGCDSWTIKKAEHWRIDSFQLWCWRKLLRVPWTARRSNQPIQKEINSKYSLERLLLKLKFQYFGHLMWRADSLEKTLMPRKIEDKRWRVLQKMRWLNDITDSMDMNLSKFWEMVEERKAWHAAVHGVAKSWTLLISWTTKEVDHRDYRGGKREKSSLELKFQKLETLYHVHDIILSFFHFTTGNRSPDIVANQILQIHRTWCICRI